MIILQQQQDRQIVRLRIGISELLALNTAVSEKAEMNKLLMESACE